MKNIWSILLLVSILMMTQTVSASDLILSDTSKLVQLEQQIAALDIEDDEHCEVPCGIYGDSLRIALIDEHIRTVEKAMNKINDLSKESKPNYNQLIRWVMNKETHAEEIQQIVSQYFLHQRIKLTDSSKKKAYKKYKKHLAHLHKIQVYAMKCKQTTDLKNVNELKGAVEAFEGDYFHSH